MGRQDDFMANLMAAKKVMDITDEQNPIKSIGGNNISETTKEREVNWGQDTTSMLSEAEMVAQGNVPQRQANLTAPPVPQNNQIENSRLPANIKKAMMENPIPQATMPSNSFSLEQMQQYMGQNGQPMQQQPQQIQENIQQPMNINENMLRKLVNEEVQKYFAKYFMKNMTENVKKRIRKK